MIKKRTLESLPEEKIQKTPKGKFRVIISAEEETETITHNSLMDEEAPEGEPITKPIFKCRTIDFNTPPTYASLIEALIRDRYSVSDELAIQRQRSEKPEEFEAYNTYAEECKQLAASILSE